MYTQWPQLQQCCAEPSFTVEPPAVLYILLLVLIRSLVPASSQKMIERSRNIVVDNVTYDLEDSVALHKKAEARLTLRKHFHQPRSPHIKDQALRINSVSSGLGERDLNEVVWLTFL